MSVHPPRFMLLLLIFGVIGAGIGVVVDWEVGAAISVSLLCALILLVMVEDVAQHRRRRRAMKRLYEACTDHR